MKTPRRSAILGGDCEVLSAAGGFSRTSSPSTIGCSIPKDSRYCLRLLQDRCCGQARGTWKIKHKLRPMSGKAVTRTAWDHQVVEDVLRDAARASKRRGYMVVPFDYPSTRIDIATGGRIPRPRDPITRKASNRSIFVVHSNGRASACGPGSKTTTILSVSNASSWLGTPKPRRRNGPTCSARTPPFRLIMGPAGSTACDGRRRARSPRLPYPPCEFGIIAGGRGSEGYNPLVPGDNGPDRQRPRGTRLPGSGRLFDRPAPCTRLC